MKKCGFLVVMLLVAASVQATVLTFQTENNFSGTMAPSGHNIVMVDTWTGDTMTTGYGDFVASGTQTGRKILMGPAGDRYYYDANFKYGVGAEGYTPNVSTFLEAHPVPNNPTDIFSRTWNGGYGSQAVSIWNGALNELNTANFYGHNGKNVKLYSLGVSGWGTQENVTVKVYAITLNGLTDGSQDDLYTKGALVYQTTVLTDLGGSTISLGGVEGSAFRVEVTDPGMTGGSSAVSNIVFGEVVPEPATMAILGLGGLLLRRSRK